MGKHEWMIDDMNMDVPIRKLCDCLHNPIDGVPGSNMGLKEKEKQKSWQRTNANIPESKSHILSFPVCVADM